MAFSPPSTLVERTNLHTRSWRQGDVIEPVPMAWLVPPGEALTQEGANAQGNGLSYIVTDSPGLAIVSQTCDVVRDCAERPFVLLAPVVELQDPSASEATRGMRPRYVPVPGVGDSAFVDLDLVVSAEKSVLLGVDPRRGLPDESSQRRFGAGIARAFSRLAFPDDLHVALRGLMARVKGKHARNSPEGRALRVLDE